MKIGCLVKKKNIWPKWTKKNPWMKCTNDNNIGIIVDIDYVGEAHVLVHWPGEALSWDAKVNLILI